MSSQRIERRICDCCGKTEESGTSSASDAPQPFSGWVRFYFVRIFRQGENRERDACSAQCAIHLLSETCATCMHPTPTEKWEECAHHPAAAPVQAITPPPDAGG